MGLAIYSVIQMGIMALGIGLMVQWIRTRFRLNRWLTWLMLVVFGCSPYIAQYSIAIWKDPIFSVTIVCVTILLFDILYVETDKKQNIIRNILLLISVLAMIFSRNNGFYIAIAIVCLSVFLLFRKMTRQKGIQILVICLIVMIASKFITGPVYDAYGIVKDDEKAESYGIFLAQMARVVVENGELSAEDSDYMGRLLPMEEYQSAYTPCLVDNLKWNPNFQKEVLEDGFFRTYLSILRKNPRICFEAWELQTFGFWSVNQKWVNGFTGNILNGVPRNIYPEYGIYSTMYTNWIYSLVIDWSGSFCLVALGFSPAYCACTGAWTYGYTYISFANILLAALWTCPTITVTIIYSNDISTRRRTPKWTKLQF